MVRTIVSVLSVFAIVLPAQAQEYAPPIPFDDHRGSGRYSEVRCPDGTKYRNSGCQPL
jgi:hypothetical protein